jgi:hypothetical protein
MFPHVPERDKSVVRLLNILHYPVFERTSPHVPTIPSLIGTIGAEGILSLDTDESISHLEEMLSRIFGRSMPDSEHGSTL